MSHSEICPVCKGKGNTREKNKEPKEGPLDCHGCGGKGWVTVEDKPKTEQKFVTNEGD